MTPKRLISYATRRYANPLAAPMLVLGPPGVGKTAVAQQIAEALAVPRHLWPVMARQGVDVGGYPQPVPAEGITRFLPAESLVKAGAEGGILFLDELPQCPETDQPSYLKLVHERLAGEVKLPDTLRFMAAGNRPNDGSGRNRLLEALRERFTLVAMEPCAVDWLDWAAKSRLNPLVRDYIRARGNDAGPSPGDTILFSSPDLRRGHVEGSPNPRAWHMLANELDAAGPDADVDDILEVGGGIVGSPSMTDFQVWLDLRKELIDPAHVLANPDGASVPTDASALYVSCSILADHAATIEGAEPLNAAARWYNRLPGDFAAFGAYELACARPELPALIISQNTPVPDAKKLLQAHAAIFVS